MRKTGEAAPGFRLRTLDGGFASLDELIRQGPVALAFFKISCPVCQNTLPFLQRLSGHNIVLISQDTAADTQEFHEQFRITLPTLLDERREGYPASNAWGLTHVPSLFIVEPNGTVSLAQSGFSRDALEQIGRKFDVPVFRPDENTPTFRPG